MLWFEVLRKCHLETSSEICLRLYSVWYRDWSPKFETGLNIIIGIVKKSIHKNDQAVILPKWYHYEYIILAKGQLGHSCAFWKMPIMIFSLVSNFGDQSLVWWKFWSSTNISKEYRRGQFRIILWFVEIFKEGQNFRRTRFPADCRAKVRSYIPKS